MIKVNARADAIGVGRAVIGAMAVVVDSSETGGGADIADPPGRAIAGNRGYHLIKVNAWTNTTGVRRAASGTMTVAIGDTSETGGGANISEPKIFALLSRP